MQHSTKAVTWHQDDTITHQGFPNNSWHTPTPRLPLGRTHDGVPRSGTAFPPTLPKFCASRCNIVNISRHMHATATHPATQTGLCCHPMTMHNCPHPLLSTPNSAQSSCDRLPSQSQQHQGAGATTVQDKSVCLKAGTTSGDTWQVRHTWQQRQ